MCSELHWSGLLSRCTLLVIKATIKRFNVTWCQECLRSMAFLHSLPALHSLEINDSNVAEKWSEWKEMWEHNSVASEVNKEEGDVQAAALLTAIGPEARKVFKTWNLSATERKDIKDVIERFDNYCNPRKNIPFERYLFNSRQQEPGESISFDRYVTALRQIADKCAFDAITAEDLLRDRIIFGIADNKVRERLLREPELNLAKSWISVELRRCLKRRLKQWGSSTHPMCTFSRKTRSPQRDSRLLQINFVILVVSAVGGTKVSARPARLGASSVSSAVKRTILLGNAPFLLPPIKCHCLRKRTSCLSSKFSKCQLIKARIQVL